MKQLLKCGSLWRCGLWGCKPRACWEVTWMFLKVNTTTGCESVLFPPQRPPPPTHPLVLAAAHLYCVVFVVSFTSSAAQPLMSAQLMNLMKYVALLGVSLEANGTCRKKKTKKNPIIFCSLFQSADGLTRNETQRVRYGRGVGGVCEPGFALPAEPLIKLTDKWRL